ncbi:MAG TPA: hypothetical protein VKH62_10950 [Candidatus Binatia bacterium]|nr:hypothetical protein [Candidatus Binatia bacterium]
MPENFSSASAGDAKGNVSHHLVAFAGIEAQLKRLAGGEGGHRQCTVRLTLPVRLSYFWCLPMSGQKLDLRSLGIYTWC